MKEDHIFYFFVPGVTEANEDAEWVQDFIFLFLVLIKGITKESE